MERSGLARRSGWMLVVGLILGALLMPRIAEAVGSIVTIQGGGSSTKAGVTKGNQLQVAEAAPSSFRVFTISSGSNNCVSFGTIPSNKGFIVKTVNMNVPVESSSNLVVVVVWPNGSCQGNPMVSAPTKVVGAYSFPFEPGFAMASGRHFSMQVAAGGSVAFVSIVGYLVPSADVPATTPISN
jgi:hypothetical protein